MSAATGSAPAAPWPFVADLGTTARIVVRMPNWLGDALFAVPTLRALRSACPLARLELLARRSVAEVLLAFDDLADGVLVGGDSTLRGVRADVRSLRGCSAVLLLPNSFASALAPAIARVPLRVGCAGNLRGALLTHAMASPSREHQARRYLAVSGFPDTALAAGPESAPGQVLPGVALSKVIRDRAQALAPTGGYAVLVPGAAFGGAKRWGAERFADLGRRLRVRGLEILVLGSAAERELAQAVAAGAGGRSLAGDTTGGEFAGLLAGAAVVAANDSGALHLAAALGVPAIGLYGPTEPAATGPLSHQVRVLAQPVACRPCGLRECNQPSHRCMELITPEMAVMAVEGLLERSRPAAACAALGQRPGEVG